MPPKSRPETSWRPSWLLKCTLLLAGVAVFLAGVIWAGRWGLEQLQGNDRYLIPFADIDCEPPVGMDRHKFLDEVRYYASPHLPERLNLLNANLALELRDGFARHPWVEKADVVIQAPRHVMVKLTFRTARNSPLSPG